MSQDILETLVVLVAIVGAVAMTIVRMVLDYLKETRQPVRVEVEVENDEDPQS